MKAGRVIPMIVLAMAVISAMAVPSASAAEGVDNDQGGKVIYSYTCDFAYEGTDAQNIEWDFGFVNPDGSRATSNEWNPSGVVFPGKGVYVVTQTVSNTVGRYVSQISLDIRGTPEVTFESNGGTQVPMQLVKAGLFADKPADPVRDGFSFGGWHTDAECTSAFDWTTPVTQHVRLYAKWTAVGGGDGGNEGGSEGGNGSGEGNDGGNGEEGNGNDGGEDPVEPKPTEDGNGADIASIALVMIGAAGLIYVFSRPPEERKTAVLLLFVLVAAAGAYCLYADIDIMNMIFGGGQ